MRRRILGFLVALFVNENLGLMALSGALCPGKIAYFDAEELLPAGLSSDRLYGMLDLTSEPSEFPEGNYVEVLDDLLGELVMIVDSIRSDGAEFVRDGAYDKFSRLCRDGIEVAKKIEKLSNRGPSGIGIFATAVEVFLRSLEEAVSKRGLWAYRQLFTSYKTLFAKRSFRLMLREIFGEENSDAFVTVYSRLRDMKSVCRAMIPRVMAAIVIRWTHRYVTVSNDAIMRRGNPTSSATVRDMALELSVLQSLLAMIPLDKGFRNAWGQEGHSAIMTVRRALGHYLKLLSRLSRGGGSIGLNRGASDAEVERVTGAAKKLLLKTRALESVFGLVKTCGSGGRC